MTSNNSKTAVATLTLTATTKVAEMLQGLKAGTLTVPQVVSHLTTTPCPITEVAQLAGTLDAASFGAILVAQQALAVKAAVGKRPAANALSLKVGQSGTVVVKGLGRNPLSAYVSQWRRIASELFGIDDAAWAASPMGRWVAGDPCEVYSVAKDYAKYDGGADRLAKLVANNVATVTGDSVAVILSTSKD